MKLSLAGYFGMMRHRQVEESTIQSVPTIPKYTLRSRKISRIVVDGYLKIASGCACIVSGIKKVHNSSTFWNFISDPTSAW